MKKKIYIAGHRGMVGSALVRELSNQPGVELFSRSHAELDLVDQSAVSAFFQKHKFDEVYLAAGKVGGIHANNTYPAEFIYENIMIQANVINSAYQSAVKKLLLLGSSCIYPRLAEQPMSESALLTGELEPTNEPYAIAKIAGIKLCESYNIQYGVDYRSVMPTNLYGENDNFHPDNSHVIPAMMRRFHNAKVAGDTQVVVWGSGKPMREFLYVDDMAQASIHVMNLTSDAYRQATQERVSHINIGTGVDCTIAELAQTLKKVVGFGGDLVFDATKPDGAPRKLLDVSRASGLGWQSQISLEQGLSNTYSWFLNNETALRES
jgi:GDP-L-fucose synthase